MKLVSRPISSPSRLDKFPPPLMRLLRNNGGSRSRGRSRSSPIFIRRRNEPNADNNQEEPSSPKVTCMGQVRVARSKKRSSKNTSPPNKKVSCFSIPKALFPHHSCSWPPAKLWLCHYPSFWGRWCCAPFGIRMRRKSSEKRRDARREETGEYLETGQYDETEEADEYDEEDERDKVFVSCSPPKNALVLMRCKSEPPKASSLAYKFWSSPPSAAAAAAESQEHRAHPIKQEEEEEEEEEGEIPMSSKEPICRDSAAESRIDPENKENVVYTERLSETSKSVEAEEEGESARVFAERVLRRENSRPVMLPRSLSEPARRRAPEKVDSEAWYWKRRLNIFEMPNTTRL